MVRAMRWSPIAVDRRLRARVRTRLAELAALLAEPLDGASPSLALGDAGTAVLFAYLRRARFPFRHAADRARLYAQRAARAIGAQAMPLGLFGGVAGIAWMLEHLRGVELPRHDECSAIDGALRAAIERGTLDGEPDLVTGLAGIGVYALARRDRLLATAVVAALGRALAHHGDDALWTPPARGAPDLGTAHGVAGIAAMLGQASAQTIPGATVLWRHATRRLLACARWDLPAVFPARAPNSDTDRDADCRLAWCYGDIGAACALASAADAAGHARLAATAARVAHRAAVRTPDSSGVVDGGICHGAAGVAFGLHRMFVATRAPALRDAACRWLTTALDDGIPAELHGGSHAEHARGLLGGAGIALVYLAAITAVTPAWSSMLTMVATPGVARRAAKPRRSQARRPR